MLCETWVIAVASSQQWSVLASPNDQLRNTDVNTASVRVPTKFYRAAHILMMTTWEVSSKICVACSLIMLSEQ